LAAAQADPKSVDRELVGKLQAEFERIWPRQFPVAKALEDILDVYQEGNSDKFNESVAAYRGKYLTHVTAANLNRVDVESFFNGFKPFYQCMCLYIFAFVFAAGSWLGWQKPLRQSALGLAMLAAVVHTAALIVRMYLQNRPFVFITNLYSTAIFIGWA